MGRPGTGLLMARTWIGSGAGRSPSPRAGARCRVDPVRPSVHGTEEPPMAALGVERPFAFQPRDRGC